MKKIALCLALVSLLALGGQAIAVQCTIDAVPAATLLLPYFQVDLDNPNGLTTLFSVNNASATAVLAHVVLWGDWTVPVLDFDIYLTGYDVQTINLRDIIVLGNLPETASDGQDPADTISPQGDFSQDINFASCSGILPYSNPALNASFLAHLQAALTGNLSALLGGYAGENFGDNIARGYITVDTVNACNLLFPGDAGYFGDGGTGFATNQNVLWGDWFYVNSDNNFAQGDTLVHVEAFSSVQSGAWAPGDYTFYGRYVAATAIDNREPLGTNFAVRYINGGAFDGGTDLICWRDSKIVSPSSGWTIAGPTWWPLGQGQIVIFDEQENPETPDECQVSPCPPGEFVVPCRNETNLTLVDGPDFPISFDFGWLFLNLNTTTGGFFDPDAQAWVGAIYSAEGRYSIGLNAIQLDSACAASHVAIGG